ncbi:hypothetical protein C8R47DRAFT_1206058 [Mycena vitilis]|nr:hypothetical protein C8R47DRAFT_1206058 [Mycena vitilis]
MSDSVAEKSGLLKPYLSSHPETLVGYAKWYGKVGEPIASVEISAIDSKKMTLTCTLKSGSKKEVVVAINPPLSDYEDAKPRLLEMKAISQEGLGLIKSPQITSFHLPPDGYYTALILFGLVPLAAFAPSTFNAPAQLLNIVQKTLKYLFFTTSVAYVVCTFFVGLPTWKDILHRVKNARIESATKIE